MLETELIFIKPSKQFIALLSLVCIGSIGIIMTLQMALSMQLALIIASIGYGILIGWRYGYLRSQWSILGIQPTLKGPWRLRLKDRDLDAELLGSSTVTRWVSILRFKPSGKKWPLSCIVFNDSIDEGPYRQLLLILRCCSV